MVRWNVCLANGDKLSLKEDNLEVLEMGLDAMVAALEQAGEHDKAAVLRSTLDQHQQGLSGDAGGEAFETSSLKTHLADATNQQNS